MQTAPGDDVLMSSETSSHFVHLLLVSNMSLKSDFIHGLIHVYSPGADTDSPHGTKF